MKSMDFPHAVSGLGATKISETREQTKCTGETTVGSTFATFAISGLHPNYSLITGDSPSTQTWVKHEPGDPDSSVPVVQLVNVQQSSEHLSCDPIKKEPPNRDCDCSIIHTEVVSSSLDHSNVLNTDENELKIMKIEPSFSVEGYDPNICGTERNSKVDPDFEEIRSGFPRAHTPPFPVALFQHQADVGINIKMGLNESIDDPEMEIAANKTEVTRALVASKNSMKANCDKDVSLPNDPKTFKCSICEYSSADKKSISHHMINHTGARPCICYICDYAFATQIERLQHAQKHLGEKPYKCSYCDYRTDWKQALNRHKISHTGKKPKTDHLADTNSDIASSDAKGKPYKCPNCDFRYDTKGKLVRHARTHLGEKPHKCSQCDYRTDWKQALDQHMISHSEDKPFECSYCGYKAGTSQEFVRHTRTHPGGKPYKCSDCGYETARKFDFDRHRKTHTGEKPFACSICEYKFIAKIALVHHMRTHTGEKPYVCSACDYKSATKTLLVDHIRKHTGEKPYTCSICDYRAAQRGALTTHMKKHRHRGERWDDG